MKAPTKAQLARAGRRDRIVDAAREIAEVHGWPAVTVRRLADTIGFSQPVLYRTRRPARRPGREHLEEQALRPKKHFEVRIASHDPTH